MARLFALSIDRASGDPEERARAWADPELLPRLVETGRLREGVLLRTCCRTELYAVAAEGLPIPPSELSGGIRSVQVLEGLDAVRRLLRVLLGLESLAPGEEHVVRQVKEAYGTSMTCGRILHRLFQRAFGVAATLRGAWGPGRPPSIPGLMVKRWLRSPGSPPDGDEPEDPDGRAMEPRFPLRALVVGAGAMAEASLTVLGACRIGRTLTARRPEAVRGLIASASGGTVEPIPWEDWRRRLTEFDAVFLCTAAADPILSAEDFPVPSGERLPAICDLGQPPQLAPDAPEGLVRFALDDLAREAEAAAREHTKALERLSEEADRAAEALYAEVTRAGGDAWRRLALARTSSVAREKAEAEARRIGVPREELERFAASVLSTYLRPLVAAPAAHAERAFRILSGADGGTGEGSSEEP